MSAANAFAGGLDLEYGAAHFEHSASKHRRMALYGIVAFAALILGGAVLVPAGGAVIAPAEVAPESRIKRIAHPSGGIISEILVEDGDRVRRGDLLMRFDTSVSALDAELTERSLEQLFAQEARLEAEMNEGSAMKVPLALSMADISPRNAVDAERRRFALNSAERASLAAQLVERVNQLRRQIEGYEVQIGSLRKQQTLIEPELATLRNLSERGYVTIQRLNALERTAIELEGSIGALQANVAQINAAIAEAQQQRLQIGQTARAQAGAELAQVKTAINQQRVASANAGDRFDRSAIRAPFSGTVANLAFNAVGEVVRPADTILEIVPADDRLVFEGRVPLTEIDRVRVGQSARIRLSALNQATTPELTGRLIFVSADPVTDPGTGVRTFRVRVAPDRASSAAARRVGLISGMPAELFITAGSRSLWSYIFKPMRDQFARAFRD